jgi:membrane associated rhomboid family serine protease
MENPFDPGRMRDRWQWMASDLLTAKATQGIALLLIVVHLLVSLLSIPEVARQFEGSPDQPKIVTAYLSHEGIVRLQPETPSLSDRIYLAGGISRDSLLSGKVWQLVTHGALHATILHLAFNLLALLMAGLQLERILGARGLLKIFWGGVIAGGLGHVFLQPAGQANITLVGASGGIAAMFFWLITVSPDARSRYIPLSWRTLGRVLMTAQVVIVALLWLPHAGGNPNTLQIGHACHLGGSIFGWWMARRTMRPVTLSRHDLLKQRARREDRTNKTPL